MQIGRKRNTARVAAVFFSVLFFLSVVSQAAIVSNDAMAGPRVAIIQLGDDEDVAWATQDIIKRLSDFITDDPFIPDRVTLFKTGNPHSVEQFSGDIVVWVSHGGPRSIVTGNSLTTWQQMAEIVDDSRAKMHLFAACFSNNIIKYGADSSDKWIYGIPGQRPAEVIDIDIVASVMIALGANQDTIDEYRYSEIAEARDKMQRCDSRHILSYNAILLDDLGTISDEFQDIIEGIETEYRWTMTTLDSMPELPDEMEDVIMRYWGYYFDPDPIPRQILSVYVKYNKSEYKDTVHGIPGEWTYYQGTYSGFVILSGTLMIYVDYLLDVENEKANIHARQESYGLLSVYKEMVDGVWMEPRISRSSYESGGYWGDYCTTPRLKYHHSWPTDGSYTEASGSLASEGFSYTVTSVPTGSGWHGPSFIRPLSTPFRVYDLGGFRADLGLLHHGSNAGMGKTMVSLYDENKLIVCKIGICDAWAGSKKTYFLLAYYKADSSSSGLTSDYFYSDINGTLQIYYDPLIGIRADMPTKNDYILYTSNNINSSRIIKYIAIQSYRYGSYSEHHEVIANISLQYTRAEYGLFEDDCVSTFGWEPQESWPNSMVTVETGIGLNSDGSRLYSGSIPSGPASSHGPVFVQKLDQKMRLSDNLDLRVDLESIFNWNKMGHAFVVLYDANYERMFAVSCYDAWYGINSRGYVYYYKSTDEGGGYVYQYEEIYYSWSGQLRVWYDSDTDSIRASTPGGSWTLVGSGSFDPDREAYFISIQFGRKTTYSYETKYIHSIQLTCNREGKDFSWHDECSSTNGWIYDLNWPTPFVGTASGSLTSTGGYLQTSSNNGWATGPFWYKELDNPVCVNQLAEFSVEVEFSNPSNYYKGELFVGLYDSEKKLAGYVRFKEWTDAAKDCDMYVVWKYENGTSNYLVRSNVADTYWSGVLSLSYVAGTGIRASIPGLSPTTIVSEEDLGQETSRLISYVGIQWRKGSGTYLNYKLHDIYVGSVAMPRDSRGGHIPMRGESIMTDPPPSDDGDPLTTDDLTQYLASVSATWILESGWWPVCVISVLLNEVGEYYLDLSIGIDLLFSASLRSYEWGIGAGGLSDYEAQQIADEVAMVYGKVSIELSGAAFALDCLWAIAAIATAASERSGVAFGVAIVALIAWELGMLGLLGLAIARIKQLTDNPLVAAQVFQMYANGVRNGGLFKATIALGIAYSVAKTGMSSSEAFKAAGKKMYNSAGIVLFVATLSTAIAAMLMSYWLWQETI